MSEISSEVSKIDIRERVQLIELCDILSQFNETLVHLSEGLLAFYKFERAFSCITL